jgi:PTS system ascorbate-specific IIA component
MTTGILIVAHKPLASALRQCVVHVFPDSAQAVAAFDVQSDLPMEQNVAGAASAMAQLSDPHTLVLTDLFASTPCNVAREIVDGVKSRLIAGVNLPMLLRAVTYRREPMDSLVARAMAGGTQGVMQVATAAPQNQAWKKNDQDYRDHQQ